ncbi:Type III restriction enzyme, res subunit family protein [Histomonas meleagridis]|nr:Type III restriction enzyme, res subunit family protein [Histomonas meleagridis]
MIPGSYDEDTDQLPMRKCRVNKSYSTYSDFSSSESASENSKDDSDFYLNDDEAAFEEENELNERKKLQNSSHKKKTLEFQMKKPHIKQRPLNGLFKKKKQKEDSDSDFEEVNPSRQSKHYVSPLAYRREKRTVKEVNYKDDLPQEIFFSDTSDSAELTELLDNQSNPPIETIIGFQPEPELFFVRYIRSSNAEAVWLSRSEIMTHPSGPSHLSVFDSLCQQYGTKPSPSIPFLYVPATEEPEEPKPEIDHIVTYDPTHQLFLVKWKDVPYEDATWEHFVDNESELHIFQTRETYKPNKRYIPNLKPTEKLPVYKNNNQLRNYQIEALNWLRFAYHSQKNTILADEMGLGKTIQCISLLHDITTRCGVYGPFLVVAPLGTLPNWQREFENWTDIRPILFHGSKPTRDIIKKYELFYSEPHQNETKFQVLLTNIETVMKEVDIIQAINWHFVIIDEAHRLKNIHSKIYRILYSLNMEHILLMTGTPIQNNIDEIFALLHFIAPDKFPSLEPFKEKFKNIESVEDVEQLKNILKPYMLRRKKCDVEKSIAAKEETIVEVELTRIQKFYYRLLIDKKVDNLMSHEQFVKVRELQNLAMQLRKVCNHPFLLPGVEDEIIKNKPDEDPNEIMIESCGKLIFIDKLLAKLKQNNTKVLIFSQMVRVLDIIEDFLNYRDYSYVRLDGNVHGSSRQSSIDKFNDPNSNVFVFLLSTKAGGVGLNLTAASTVIIYDCDWNPQNDLQAQARCHRIGQTHDVQVYRLITRGTYESEMFLRASMKLGLDQAILDSKTTKTGFNDKEIEALIKKGAYHVFQDDETETDKFVAEDIDQILERRTKKFINSSVDTESTFSKATFIIEENDNEQIDINDEHFWERILPKDSKHFRNHNHADGLYYDEMSAPRRSRSTHNLYEGSEDEDDSEDEYGNNWNAIKRDRLLSQLVSIGYGRWELIQNRLTIQMTRIQYKGVGYRCTILNDELFEVWKSERAKWIDKTPLDVWMKVDKEFDDDPIKTFGISCSIVQFEYLKQLDNNFDELPNDFMPPKINFFQTGAKRNEKKRVRGKYKRRKNRKAKKRFELSDDYDEDDDDDDDEDYR